MQNSGLPKLLRWRTHFARTKICKIVVYLSCSAGARTSLGPKTYPTNALVGQIQLGAPDIYCGSAKQYICTQNGTEALFMCTASEMFQAQCVHHKYIVAKWMLQGAQVQRLDLCQTQR